MSLRRLSRNSELFDALWLRLNELSSNSKLLTLPPSKVPSGVAAFE